MENVEIGVVGGSRIMLSDTEQNRPSGPARPTLRIVCRLQGLCVSMDFRQIV